MNSGEESALPMVSSSSSVSNKYEGTVSRMLGSEPVRVAFSAKVVLPP